MELHKLCEAAITGNTDSLHKIVEEDPLILHKLAAGCFNGAASPLHVATISEQAEFVKALLNLKPELKLRLTEVLDLQLRSALHLASAMGNVEIVKLLLEANSKMCLVRDRDGKNPLHVAAIEGKIEVLEELVRASPQAARVRVDQNETILHLCVKHNQLGSLKKLLEMIHGRDFINAKDSDGNTILHLAILFEHFKIAGHVIGKEKIDVNAILGKKEKIDANAILGKEKIDVNATNATGHTALDIFYSNGQVYHHMEDLQVCHHMEDLQVCHRMEDLLLKANAKPAKYLVRGDWLTNKRESLMVVASLIATMAFQAGVSPPGGVWQEDSNGHRAGEAVMAYNYRKSYPYFLRSNTIGFVASLSTILLLMSGLKFRNKATMWILIVTMWLAITSMAISYAFSNVVITPRDNRQPLTNTIVIAVIVWSSVMALLLVKHTIELVPIFARKRRKMKAIERMAYELQRFLRGKDGGATPHLPVTSSTIWD